MTITAKKVKELNILQLETLVDTGCLDHLEEIQLSKTQINDIGPRLLTKLVNKGLIKTQAISTN